MPLDVVKLLLLLKEQAPLGPPPGRAKSWLVEQGQWIDYDSELNLVK